MTNQFRAFLFLSLVTLVISSCQSREEKLKQDIETILSNEQGVFAVAFTDITTGKEILLNEHETFHAASTMKTPVLIEVYKQVEAGKFSLTDSIPIKTQFTSIVDGSPYTLSAADDSEQELYHLAGQKKTISELVYNMIIVSSNLATNLVIEKVGAVNVTQTMRDLGAKDIQVLRGVEDSKAFAKDLNNTVTAFDLMIIFQQMALGKTISQEASHSMIDILLDQKYNDIIPAKLPADVKVAHKTGWITGVHHDSGIVFLPDGRKYILVLLSKELKDEKAGVETLANVSELIYQYVMDSK